MNVGNRIKKRRLELRMSVDELADELGKNRATIYRYENGDIENLPITIVDTLASILETTPAYLMGWEDDPIDYDELDIAIPDDFPGDVKDYLRFEEAVKEDVAEEDAIRAITEKIQNYVSVLNIHGKEEALKRVEELTQIPRYQKLNNSKIVKLPKKEIKEDPEIYKAKKKAEKEERELEKELAVMMERHAFAAYEGQDEEEMSQEDKELLEAAYRRAIIEARKDAKEKFTPKKYRKDKEEN